MTLNQMQLFSMAKNAQNPKQFMCNIMKDNMGQNPMFANLIQLAENGNSSEFETVARNLFKEKGLDFDNEFNTFKKNLGL